MCIIKYLIMFKVFIICRVIQIMSRHWMYNADRRSQDFIEDVHYFLGVAEANKRDG